MMPHVGQVEPDGHVAPRVSPTYRHQKRGPTEHYTDALIRPL